ncbi:hypothetical protein N8I74_06645 [Chitiniphilus purpureus]|uniref:Uncharacterized protein n=1 Tax=Chitiniphilus purpureus TaxID=2981137 RepID=A0ABY6DQP2_9NEIS|nr:hypothetical protein [Chitiniphilus sp. CD1]UXY16694.1 hypothetical protein N8I74_06645 [Chitiniphilus sp. CD1]
MEQHHQDTVTSAAIENAFNAYGWALSNLLDAEDALREAKTRERDAGEALCQLLAAARDQGLFQGEYVAVPNFRGEGRALLRLEQGPDGGLRIADCHVNVLSGYDIEECAKRREQAAEQRAAEDETNLADEVADA